jgi:RNA polymerase sigma-70 factor (ECF subfamily)
MDVHTQRLAPFRRNGAGSTACNCFMRLQAPSPPRFYEPGLNKYQPRMAETSHSLLERLQQQPDGEPWRRLVALYTPLIHVWLRRRDVPAHDCDDLVQEVLAVVVRELPAFQHNQRPGAFRAWLRTITVNRLRGYWRDRAPTLQGTGDSGFAAFLDQLADPDSDMTRRWNDEHDRHVLANLLAAVEPEFNVTDWTAFRRQALDGARAATVATELNVSVNVVLLAKSRILRRLRQEARGLVE